MSELENILKHNVLEATAIVEEHLDAELERLDRLDLDDVENLREKRLKELRKQEQENREWRSRGHGGYTELTDEREFFSICKASPNVVLVFYKRDSQTCNVLEQHIKILCVKHLEARFIKMDVERAPFLTSRLRIRIIPTIALIKDGKTVDYIVGFTELGNCENFSTEMLEWRIAQSNVIRYSGDLRIPPDQKKILKYPIFRKKQKAIRETNHGSSSDDEFYD